MRKRAVRVGALWFIDWAVHMSIVNMACLSKQVDRTTAVTIYPTYESHKLRSTGTDDLLMRCRFRSTGTNAQLDSGIRVPYHFCHW